MNIDASKLVFCRLLLLQPVSIDDAFHLQRSPSLEDSPQESFSQRASEFDFLTRGEVGVVVPTYLRVVAM